MTTTASGLQYEDTLVGIGAEAKKGDTVEMHYTGTLNNGQQFDSSRGRGTFSFQIGSGMVIAGWEEGIPGMKVGGKRTLIIPSDLGYGDYGYPGVIPPKATLHFEVELIACS
ncbi:MAG: FKBP-type peptidyl-prolyl cis-trans isomerase [Candidatus Kerfeldbacteria bacterium]|nr:FKBP-type peptidyl-prolyl cis-trans isomerase [Candidatus Kerfeldbacteria bacterium]